ncbi:hypothetical protein [Bosea beijingensis]
MTLQQMIETDAMSGAPRFALSRDFWNLDLPLVRQAFGKVEALLWMVAQAANGDSEDWRFACRVETLAKGWGWSERKVFRFLREMEATGFVSRDIAATF